MESVGRGGGRGVELGVEDWGEEGLWTKREKVVSEGRRVEGGRKERGPRRTGREVEDEDDDEEGG